MKKNYDPHASSYYVNGEDMSDGIAPCVSEGDATVDAIKAYLEEQKVKEQDEETIVNYYKKQYNSKNKKETVKDNFEEELTQ